MATLVSIVYPDKNQAIEARNALTRLQSQYLIDVIDAVVVTRDDKGKTHLDQLAPLVEMGAMNGALWGMLIGILFFAPLLGVAVGAVSGALAGKFSDYGIEDNFMRALVSNYSRIPRHCLCWRTAARQSVCCLKLLLTAAPCCKPRFLRQPKSS